MQNRLALAGTIFYWVLVGFLIWAGIRWVLPCIFPLLAGVAIAALLRPAVLSFSRRTHLCQKTSAVLVLAFFYLFATAVLCLFFTILLAQLYSLLEQLPELYCKHLCPLMEHVSNWFDRLIRRFSPDAQSILAFSQAVTDAVRQAALDTSAQLVSWMAGLAARLPMLLLAAFFSVVLSILVSTNYALVGRFIRSHTPKRFHPLLRDLQTFFRDTVSQYVRAYTIIMAVTFLELVFGLWLLRFDYVLPVAALIALVDLLPIIGSGTVLVPWGLLLIASGDSYRGFGLLILFGAMSVVRNIIEPRVIGAQIGLHPIATITAMYAGLKAAGILGMLFAPILVMLALKLQWPHSRDTS